MEASSFCLAAFLPSCRSVLMPPRHSASPSIVQCSSRLNMQFPDESLALHRPCRLFAVVKPCRLRNLGKERRRASGDVQRSADVMWDVRIVK
jgi:hypothetical protein